jgi:sugar lactone lactonase YvrE
MRRFLSLVAACSLLSMGTPAFADAPEFPDFITMEAGPEGVVVDNVGNVYVSVGGDGYTEIRRFSPSGDPSTFATIQTGPGQAPAGMAISPNGKHVYVAIGFAGVFEIDMTGTATLVPGTEDIVLPNALAFDKQGNLYITETFSFDADDGLEFYPNCVVDPFNGYFGRGGIWVVPKGGEAQLLMRDDLLTGLCVPNPIPYPIGANGLAYDHGKLVVANSEKALVLEVPVRRDGTLGAPTVVAHVDEMGPFGPWLLDGLALDVHGDIYVAAITGQAIVKVARDGSTTDVVATENDHLDFPASIAFGTGKGERQNVFVTNLSLAGPGFAGPGLAKVHIGTPGMPLP